MLKQYIKEILPLYSFLLLFCVVVFNTHFIVEHIVKIINTMTCSATDAVAVVTAIAVYIAVSTLLLLSADKMGNGV
ncbi:MAG: hypothetical protein J6A59_12370 [Lachnospiraceae bacterium]|nr:hypothetical protein [Lachnospiraceae bacterium]